MNQSERIRHLIHGYLSADLTPEECDELKALLKEDNSHMDTLLAELRMDALLKEGLRELLEEDAATVPRTPVISGPIRFPYRLTAVAAALIILAAAFFLQQPDPAGIHGYQPKALTLTRALGPVMVRTGQGAWRSLAAGEQFVTGQELRLSASGGADFAMGEARLKVHPRGRLTFDRRDNDGSGRLRLLEGTFELASPDSGKTLLPLSRAGLSLTGKARIARQGNSTTVCLLQGKGQLYPGGSYSTALALNQPTTLDGTILPAAAVAPEPAPARKKKDLPVLGRLMLRDSSGRETEPMEIEQVRIHAQVHGPVALTEMELTFRNPTNRQAEGVFYYPLPAGASISRFAMYLSLIHI